MEGKSCVPNLDGSFSLKFSLGVWGNLPGVVGLRLDAETLAGRIGFKPLFFLAYLLELVPVPPSWFWVFSPLVASSPEVEVGLGFCQLEPFTEVLDLRRTRLTNKVKFYFQKFSYAICFLQEVSSFLICPYITQWIVSSFQQTTYKTDKTVGSQKASFFQKISLHYTVARLFLTCKRVNF